MQPDSAGAFFRARVQSYEIHLLRYGCVHLVIETKRLWVAMAWADEYLPCAFHISQSHR